MTLQNGRLPSSVLAVIPGGHLEKQASASWLAMRDFIGKHHNVWIAPLGPNSSYRTYAAQVYFHTLFEHGGNTAAEPGTSNHGWGNAVDVASTAMAYYIRKYGSHFGWSHDEGARVGEWWHFRYVGGYKPVAAFVNLRPHSTGKRVQWVQRRLRHKGFKSVPAPGHQGYGFYGASTESAVRRFQRAHKNVGTPDGVVGINTWRALAR